LNDNETIKISCGKCKQEMRVHKPALVRIDNGLVTQVSLVPSWSPDERICRNCGAVNAPRIPNDFPFVWVAYEQPKMQNIVEPTVRQIEEISKHKRMVG
jgi:hypothetical protein